MASLSTRPATLEDAEAAVAVVRDSIRLLCVADHQNDAATLEQWLGNKTVAQFVRWLADEERFMVVAELHGVVCGVGAIQRDGGVRLCYVKPGTQGHGVGLELMNALEVQARGWGCSELTVQSSLRARSFYERCGFTPSGEPKCGFGLSLCYPYHKLLR
jgi:GNAT superfamily N-acetyltransferase